MDQKSRFMQRNQFACSAVQGNDLIDEIERKAKISYLAESLDRIQQEFADMAIQKEEKGIPAHIYVSNFIKGKIDEDMLEQHFSQYGCISDIFLPTDSNGKARGFAYITFSKLLKHPVEDKHVINGCELQIDQDLYRPMTEEKSPALLIKGFIQKIPTSVLHEHFSNYGVVIEIFRKFDTQTKTFPRYAFILFSSSYAVERATKEHDQMIGGQFVFLRRATNLEISGKVVQDSPKASSIEVNENDLVKYRIMPIENITLDALKTYFNNFGKVLDYYIPTLYGKKETKDFAYVTLARTIDKPFVKQGWQYIDGIRTRVELELPTKDTKKSNCIMMSASPRIITKISEADIRNYFKQYGKIKEIRKPMDNFKKSSIHCAFIEFTTSEAVEKAIQKCLGVINNLPFSVSKSIYEQQNKH